MRHLQTSPATATMTRPSRERKPLAYVPTLGVIELGIMGYLWRRRHGTSTEIHNAIGSTHYTSANSVCVILNRLRDKGLVDRATSRIPYVYVPLVTRDEFIEQIAQVIREA